MIKAKLDWNQKCTNLKYFNPKQGFYLFFKVAQCQAILKGILLKQQIKQREKVKKQVA